MRFFGFGRPRTPPYTAAVGSGGSSRSSSTATPTTPAPYITPKLRRLTIVGLALTLVGGTLYATFPGFLTNALKSQLQIKPGNEFTKMWTKIPFPAQLDVHLFTIDNPAEFENGAKARLKEMGPYSYDLMLYKDIVSFNQDQTTVKYFESASFDVRPETVARLKDKVRVLNFPIYVMANLVRDLVGGLPLSSVLTPVAMGFVNVLFLTHGESLVKEITVGELLNGYPFGILQTIDTVTKPLAWFGIKLPDTGMPDNKFGFLWAKNYSKSGPLQAYTGQKGTTLLDQFEYKDQRELPFYDEPKCNEIRGTEGTTLGIGVDRSKLYYVFNSDTCRVFNVKYQKDTWVRGIPTYRFTPNPNLFRAPSKNPDNRCFCHTPDDEDMCDGVFDLTRCLGAPIAYSFPQFYQSSYALRTNVEGMNPTQDEHEAYIDVEPFMGSPLRGYEKLQSNAIIKPIPYLAGFRNFRPTTLPIMWIQKGAIINDEFTFKLRMALYPIYAIFFLIYGMMFGGLMILAGVGYQLYRKSSQVDDENSRLKRRSPAPTPSKTAIAPEK